MALFCKNCNKTSNVRIQFVEGNRVFYIPTAAVYFEEIPDDDIIDGVVIGLLHIDETKIIISEISKEYPIGNINFSETPSPPQPSDEGTCNCMNLFPSYEGDTQESIRDMMLNVSILYIKDLFEKHNVLSILRPRRT